MNFTTVFYRTALNRHTQEHTGPYSVVEGGLVLHVTELSQRFVPYHMIDGIQQTQGADVPIGERIMKSLTNVHRMR